KTNSLEYSHVRSMDYDSKKEHMLVNLMLLVVISYVNAAIDTTAIGFKRSPGCNFTLTACTLGLGPGCIFTLTACTLGLGPGCIFTLTAIAKWECRSYGRALALHARGTGLASAAICIKMRVLQISISAMVIENKVKTLTINTFLLLANKEVLSAMHFRMDIPSQPGNHARHMMLLDIDITILHSKLLLLTNCCVYILSVITIHQMAVFCPNMVPNSEKLMEVFIGGLPKSIEGNVTALKPQTLEEAITITQRLMEQVVKHNYAQEANDHKRKFDDRRNTTDNNNYPKNHNNNYQDNRNNKNRNHEHHQHNRRQETFRTYAATNGYTGNRPFCERFEMENGHVDYEGKKVFEEYKKEAITTRNFSSI
ncbi:hypothetical protein Tco_0226880, partial [Tanacetum coccineum]